MKEMNFKFYRQDKWKKFPEVVECAWRVKGIRTFIPLEKKCRIDKNIRLEVVRRSLTARDFFQGR